jgi:hypothetical protein
VFFGLLATLLVAALLWGEIALTKPNLVRGYVPLNRLHGYIIETYDFFLWIVAITQGILACAVVYFVCRWLKKSG